MIETCYVFFGVMLLFMYILNHRYHPPPAPLKSFNCHGWLYCILKGQLTCQTTHLSSVGHFTVWSANDLGLMPWPVPAFFGLYQKLLRLLFLRVRKGDFFLQNLHDLHWLLHFCISFSSLAETSATVAYEVWKWKLCLWTSSYPVKWKIV